MSDKSTLGLSRRRVLGGLGAIGVASAGAGLGTSAYFSDEESFVGNILEAGSLDLYVHVDYEEDQGSYAEYDIETVIQGDTTGEGIEGEPLTIDVEDLKPGDSGEGQLCFSIVDNPAYMWMCGELVANDENTVTEPEADANGEDNDYSENPIDGMGELADAMEVSLWYCDADGEAIEGGDITSGSLAEVLTELQSGLALDGDVGTEGRQPFDGVGSPFDDEEEPNVAEPCVCLKWEVPTDVSNEIQTDSIEFDISFAAVQSRHNDGDANPCVDESYTADYVNPEGIGQPIPGGVLRLDIAYGERMVVYDILFDEPEDSDYDLYDPDFASSNFSMPFNADPDDGIYDFQIAWDAEDDDDFHYSAVTSAPNWEKDTSAGWSELPAGVYAVKNGPEATIAVPRSMLEGGSDDDYVFGFNAGAGGEQPNVSIPDGGPYSSNGNWTSSENGVESTLQ